MKIRHLLVLVLLAAVVAACNFNLASDVTPPPDYVPPTPAPTLGPQFPKYEPDLRSGAMIYAEKCAACHGDTGMGDGAQGKQLPVSVAPLGLATTAQAAKPADWYITVTQGRMDRMMPPFNSLSDQERWDVVSYAMSMHLVGDQVAQGEKLFKANCADCTTKFSDPEFISNVSENDLARIVKEGQGDIPAFGKNLSDAEASAIATYLRQLSYMGAPAPTLVPATATPVVDANGTPVEGTPSADGTPAANETPAPVAGMGTVSGSIDNQTGKALPSGMTVKLHAMEHTSDPNAGPTEIATYDGTVSADGTFKFENIEIPANRIFTADVTVSGSTYQSSYAIVKDGVTDLVIPPVTVFEGTSDFSNLKIDSLQMYFDFAVEGTVQIFTVYTITNDSNKTITVKMPSATEVPFIAFPEGAEAMGFQATSDTATFLQTPDGFAMPPSTSPYGLIAFSSLLKSDKIAITQKALLPIGTVSIFLPEGMNAKGDGLKDEGVQAQNGTNYHAYSSGAVASDGSFSFTVSGKPQTGTQVNPNVLQNKTLLIGVAALGLALVLAGAWLFLRGPKAVDETDGGETGESLGDAESMMDAIIALDDLHRNGKLSDEAYKTRREELKNALKKKQS